MLRNVAVAGLSAWAGDMAGGFISPMLPRGADGTVNPMVDKAVRYGLIGLAVIYGLRSFGHRKG